MRPIGRLVLGFGGAAVALVAACSVNVVDAASGAASSTASHTATSATVGVGTASGSGGGATIGSSSDGGGGFGGAGTGGAAGKSTTATGVLASTGAYTQPSACLQPDTCAAACANGLFGSPAPASCADACEHFLINAGGCFYASHIVSCVAGVDCPYCGDPEPTSCKTELEQCLAAVKSGDTSAYVTDGDGAGCGAGCNCFGSNDQGARYIEDCVGASCACYRNGVFHGSCTRACAAEPCTDLDLPCCGEAFGWPVTPA